MYDLLGREIATLVDQYQQAGNHEVALDADKFSLKSGLYYYRITIGSNSQTKKMICIK